MSEHSLICALVVAPLIASSFGCGSSASPPDAGAVIDAGRADAASDSQLREDFCAYWPLDPGLSCGEVIFGSVEACLEAIEPCDDSELLGVGFCWEGAGERCDPSCVPDCANSP
jgi:hypothetical protein